MQSEIVEHIKLVLVTMSLAVNVFFIIYLYSRESETFKSWLLSFSFVSALIWNIGPLMILITDANNTIIYFNFTFFGVLMWATFWLLFAIAYVSKKFNIRWLVIILIPLILQAYFNISGGYRDYINKRGDSSFLIIMMLYLVACIILSIVLLLEKIL